VVDIQFLTRDDLPNVTGVIIKNTEVREFVQFLPLTPRDQKVLEELLYVRPNHEIIIGGIRIKWIKYFVGANTFILIAFKEIKQQGGEG